MQGVRVQSLVGKLRSCALCRYRLTNQLLALPTLPSLPKHPFLSTCWWHKYWPHCCSSSSHRTQQSLSWKEDTWAHSPRVCGGVCVCVCVHANTLLGPLLSSSYRSGNCPALCSRTHVQQELYARCKSSFCSDTVRAHLAQDLEPTSSRPPGECSWSGQDQSCCLKGREQTQVNRKLIFPNMITSREAVINP